MISGVGYSYLFIHQHIIFQSKEEKKMAYLNLHFANFSYLFIPKFIFNKYLYGSLYFSSDFSKSPDRPVGRPKLKGNFAPGHLSILILAGRHGSNSYLLMDIFQS